MEDLRQSLQQVSIIESNYPNLLKGYINIDLYSQNRHQNLRLPSQYSARNMGKNDIWIAATAAALCYPLISTDHDFEHLDEVFLDLRLMKIG